MKAWPISTPNFSSSRPSSTVQKRCGRRAADRLTEAKHKCALVEMREADVEKARLLKAADAILSTLVNTPARTPAGMLVKERVVERCGFEADQILNAIAADMKALAAAGSQSFQETAKRGVWVSTAELECTSILRTFEILLDVLALSE
jgi:hypothetical protein